MIYWEDCDKDIYPISFINKINKVDKRKWEMTKRTKRKEEVLSDI
jgi:hypothetical protein